ncbi:MAG: tetratricopeptide repeat protein [Leptolyngbyaceae cyanobacterium SL_7_1]|nr:tetratricopeptide repeat protein [Leptolyngbyaceae cyanobacterium SL_7_1]
MSASKSRVDRAFLWYEQHHYGQAEAELRLALVDDPQHTVACALLALCLMHLKHYGEATDAAHRAIRLDPTLPFGFYALAHVLNARHRLPDAEAAIAQAIRLDSGRVEFFSLQSAIEFDRGNWDAALAAAEQGLQCHGDHLGCTNLRAMSLVKLNRAQEAMDSIQQALTRYPDNASVYANHGWLLLAQARPVEAMHAFREALRLDPHLKWARQGVIQAFKARKPLYQWMLRYFLWMSQLSLRTKWLIVGMGWLAAQLLGPFLWFYLLFVFLTWVADPVATLLLRLDRYGRLVLSEREIRASNWVAGLLGVALASLSVGLWLQTPIMLINSFVWGMLIVPVSAIFHCAEGGPRRTMTLYTVVLAAIGLSGLAIAIVQGLGIVASSILLIFLLGAFISGILANVLLQQQPQV